MLLSCWAVVLAALSVQRSCPGAAVGVCCVCAQISVCGALLVGDLRV